MRARTLAAAVVGIALMAPAPVADAADFLDGMAAYGRGDVITALRAFHGAAEGGNATAQLALGHLYSGKALGMPPGRGQPGVPVDYAEAAQWYRMAATQGVAAAQLHLGLLFLEGSGVLRDPVQAYVWFDQAFLGSPAGPERDRAMRLRDTTARVLSARQLRQALDMSIRGQWTPTDEALPGQALAAVPAPPKPAATRAVDKAAPAAPANPAPAPAEESVAAVVAAAVATPVIKPVPKPVPQPTVRPAPPQSKPAVPERLARHDGTRLIAARDVNLRAHPARGAPRVGVLRGAEEVRLMSEHLGWLQVTTAGISSGPVKAGWVDGRFLKPRR